MIYANTNWDVCDREGIPPELRNLMLDRETCLDKWQQHPHFAANAASLHGFHNNLRAATAQVLGDIESLMDSDADDAMDELPRYKRANHLAPQLIAVAHSHHHAEDHIYFPKYLESYPSLSRLFTLLEADHRVLEQSLDDLTSSMAELRHHKNQASVAKAHSDASKLGKVINRHLDDEEDIVMPAILGRATN